MRFNFNIVKRCTFSLLILSLFISFTVFCKDKFPNPTNLKYVNDYTNTINETYVKSIVSIGKELEDKTGAQAITVIINSTDDIPIEDYANKLFRSWGIGQKDKDNGLLILLAIEDKAWRVEVGRGLEGAIPDVLSNRIMNAAAKPSFIDGNYSEGLLNSYSIFSDNIANEYGVKLEKSLNITLPNKETTPSYKEGKFAIIIFLLLLFMDLFFNGGRVTSFFLHIFFWNNLGRGGSGNSGDGFGGFGGGSSNGGGSSGNW